MKQKKEFTALYNPYTKGYNSVILIAKSIVALFTMSALGNTKTDKAFPISPIVDIGKLIKDMIRQAKVSKWELSQKKETPTDFGETLSWEYFCYVKENRFIAYHNEKRRTLVSHR